MQCNKASHRRKTVAYLAFLHVIHFYALFQTKSAICIQTCTCATCPATLVIRTESGTVKSLNPTQYNRRLLVYYPKIYMCVEDSKCISVQQLTMANHVVQMNIRSGREMVHTITVSLALSLRPHTLDVKPCSTFRGGISATPPFAAQCLLGLGSDTCT